MEQINIMEVCGTHTMSIARAGIKQLLPESIRLISGPGCPVCVTPQIEIDAILKLSENKNIIITTYGDMLRVPGSVKGDNLLSRKAKGACVEVVFSPVDAVEIAKKNPQKEIVFLGVGFETTACGTALAIKLAKEEDLKNFSEICMLKTIEPAIRKLQSEPDFNVRGFLCPGHVAVIVGESGFRFIPEELEIPAVIAGFEPGEIIKAITLLLRQIEEGKPRLENAYKNAVSPFGNPLALKEIKTFFEPCDSLWRGLGPVEKSGLKIKNEFKEYDAGEKFGIEYKNNTEGELNGRPHCLCEKIICGRAEPAECPMFAAACTPEDPIGPCMVSSEGACAAVYKYQ